MFVPNPMSFTMAVALTVFAEPPLAPTDPLAPPLTPAVPPAPPLPPVEEPPWLTAPPPAVLAPPPGSLPLTPEPPTPVPAAPAWALDPPLPLAGAPAAFAPPVAPRPPCPLSGALSELQPSALTNTNETTNREVKLMNKTTLVECGNECRCGFEAERTSTQQAACTPKSPLLSNHERVLRCETFQFKARNC